MQVVINGKSFEYTSDFDPVDIQSNVRRKWMVSAGDYFKFPVEVGGADCFIKRFGKPGSEISGYNFLLRIKGVRHAGLPFIYDVVRVTENKKEVIYLFMEYLKGDTLDHLQRDGLTFVPLKLAGDLYYALESIHRNGFWFPDFDPKNLFRDQAGNFYIIDLDSTYPLSILPNIHIYASHDYWSPPWNYYKNELNFTVAEVKQIRGDTFNMLHLLYFMALYAYFLDEGGEDLSTLTLERLNGFYSANHKLFGSTMQYSLYRKPGTNGLAQRPLSFQVLQSFIVTCLFPGGNPVFIATKVRSQQAAAAAAARKATTAAWSASAGSAGSTAAASATSAGSTAATAGSKAGARRTAAVAGVPTSGLGVPTPAANSGQAIASGGSKDLYNLAVGGLVLLVLVVIIMASRGCFSGRSSMDSSSSSNVSAAADSSAPASASLSPQAGNQLAADSSKMVYDSSKMAADTSRMAADPGSGSSAGSSAGSSVGSSAGSSAGDAGEQKQSNFPILYNVEENFQSRTLGWTYPGATAAEVNFQKDYLELKLIDTRAELTRFCNVEADSDLTVSARLGYSGGDRSICRFGIYFCCDPERDSYYFFYITPNGEYSVSYYHDNGWTTLRSGTSDVISRGNYYNVLRIRKSGVFCSYYVNDGLVAVNLFSSQMDTGTEFGIRAEGAGTAIDITSFEVHGTRKAGN